MAHLYEFWTVTTRRYWTEVHFGREINYCMYAKANKCPLSLSRGSSGHYTAFSALDILRSVLFIAIQHFLPRF